MSLAQMTDDMLTEWFDEIRQRLQYPKNVEIFVSKFAQVWTLTALRISPDGNEIVFRYDQMIFPRPATNAELDQVANNIRSALELDSEATSRFPTKALIWKANGSWPIGKGPLIDGPQYYIVTSYSTSEIASLTRGRGDDLLWVPDGSLIPDANVVAYAEIL